MTKELPGFVLNRLQYRIINEAWDLVASGAVTAEDVDVVMKDGLGMRSVHYGLACLSFKKWGHKIRPLFDIILSITYLRHIATIFSPKKLH